MQQGKVTGRPRVIQCHPVVVTMVLGYLVNPNWKEAQREPKAMYCLVLSTILLEHHDIVACTE